MHELENKTFLEMFSIPSKQDLKLSCFKSPTSQYMHCLKTIILYWPTFKCGAAVFWQKKAVWYSPLEKIHTPYKATKTLLQVIFQFPVYPSLILVETKKYLYRSMYATQQESIKLQTIIATTYISSHYVCQKTTFQYSL